MVEQSRWAEMIARDPGHSQRYVERFRELAVAGKDIDGEARLVDAMAPRHARILDAGCGPGRVGGALARLGHDVVGVDADPVLIAAAEADHPGPTWLLADLAELDLPARGIAEGFDVIVSAGNVMPFLAPCTRAEVLRRLGLHLRDRGRIVVGFGAGATTCSASSTPTSPRPAWSSTSASPRGSCTPSGTTPTSSSPSSGRRSGSLNRSRVRACASGAGSGGDAGADGGEPLVGGPERGGHIGAHLGALGTGRGVRAEELHVGLLGLAATAQAVGHHLVGDVALEVDQEAVVAEPRLGGPRLELG